jgi:hypothetical protein
MVPVRLRGTMPRRCSKPWNFAAIPVSFVPIYGMNPFICYVPVPMDHSFSRSQRGLAELFATVLDASSDLPPVSHHALVEARDEQDFEDGLDDFIDNFEQRARQLQGTHFFAARHDRLAATVGDERAARAQSIAQLQSGVVTGFQQVARHLHESGKIASPSRSLRDTLIDPKLPPRLRRAAIDFSAGLIAADALARAIDVGHRLESWKADRLLDLAHQGANSLIQWFQEVTKEIESMQRDGRTGSLSETVRGQRVADGINRLCEAAPRGESFYPATPLE